MQKTGMKDMCLYIGSIISELEDNTEIVFEKDVYEIRDTYAFEKYCYITNNDPSMKKIFFPLIGKKNITIDGNGSEFIFSGRIIPFYMEKSENIRICNLSVDYKRPFFSQGTILDSSMKELTVQIDRNEYPYRIENNRIIFYGEDYEESYIHGFLEYDSVKKGPATGATDTFPHERHCDVTAEDVGDGIVVFRTDFAEIAQKGNIMTIKHEPRYIPGVVLDHCINVELENIHIYQAGTMALICQFSENIHLNGFCVITRKGSHRVVSCNADATHFVGCRGRLEVEHCIFESQLDDALNVHGNYLLVHDVLAPNHIIVEIGHFQQNGIWGLQKGSVIDIMQRNIMKPEIRTKVKSMKVINSCYADLIFEDEFAFDPGQEYCVDDCDSYPELYFHDNQVIHNRARGILLTSRAAMKIENNYFQTEGATIKISSDMNFWFESGAVREVVIRGNHLETTCNDNWGHGVIEIDPEMEKLEKDYYFHKTIIITENEVVMGKWPFIYGRSVDNLVITDNIFHKITEETADFLQTEQIRNIDKGGNQYYE